VRFFVKQFLCIAIKKFKGQDIYSHNFVGCFVWVRNLVLTLREERKLSMFENMVLRRIFRPRRDEVSAEWRRLHNEELNDLYSSPNIVPAI